MHPTSWTLTTSKVCNKLAVHLGHKSCDITSIPDKALNVVKLPFVPSKFIEHLECVVEGYFCYSAEIQVSHLTIGDELDALRGPLRGTPVTGRFMPKCPDEHFKPGNVIRVGDCVNGLCFVKPFLAQIIK